MRRVFLPTFLVVTAALFIGFFREAAPSTPFYYDEADYMTVARKGLRENYLETTSMSVIDFARTGLRAVRGQIGGAGLSERIRSAQDLSFLRHYHGPLYFYWLAVTRWASGESEQTVRLWGLGLHLLTYATIVVGVPLAFGPAAAGAGVLAGMLTLFCVNSIETSTGITSHVMFLWVSVLSLLAIASFVRDPAPKRFYTAFACCAISLCALEYAVLLFAALAFALALVRREFLRPMAAGELRQLALSCGGILFVVSLVLWPAALFKGTVLEGFAYILYLSYFRRGSFGDLTPLAAWKQRMALQTLDLLVVAVCLLTAAALIWTSPRRKMIAPVFLFGILMIAVTMKTTFVAPRYISAIFAPLHLSAAVLVAERMRRIPAWASRAAATLVAGTLAYNAWTSVIPGARKPAPPNENARMIALLRQTCPRSLVMPALYRPVLSYYFPDLKTRSFELADSAEVVRATIARHTPDVACVYGWPALQGETLLRMATASGELVCTSQVFANAWARPASSASTGIDGSGGNRSCTGAAGRRTGNTPDPASAYGKGPHSSIGKPDT